MHSNGKFFFHSVESLMRSYASASISRRNSTQVNERNETQFGQNTLASISRRNSAQSITQDNQRNDSDDDVIFVAEICNASAKQEDDILL